MSDNLIQQAIDKAGYDCEYNESNLINCFLDYVDSGAWSNLTIDEAEDMVESGELSVSDMCGYLIKLNR